LYALKRKAAPGVDGITWKEYETGLEDRLKDLHSRVRRGAYRALPSKRRWIPKPNGKQRPLGIAALEAERYLAELREHLRQYGLELNEVKTRLIRFGRFAAQNRAARGERKPESFTFLGLQHI
jgi:hypothetical protein